MVNLEVVYCTLLLRKCLNRPTGLYYAAFLGAGEIMVSLLEFKALKLNGTCFRGNAELVLATREGKSYTAMAEW